MKPRILLLWLALLALGATMLSACSGDDDDDLPPGANDDDTSANDDDTRPDDDDTEPPFDYVACSMECPGEQVCDPDETCREPVFPVLAPMASDLPTGDGPEHVMLNGRYVRPAGPSAWAGTQPTNLVVSPDGAVVIVNEDGRGTRLTPEADRTHNLRVYDVATWTLQQSLAMPNGSMFWGMHFNQAGDQLLVAGGEDGMVHVFDMAADHTLSLSRSIMIGGCYVADLALSPDETTLYASCVLEKQVVAVTYADGTQQGIWSAGNRPHTMVLSPDGAKLFVSNWSRGEYRAEHDTVTVIDTASGQTLATVDVGLGPEGLALSPDGGTVYSVGSKTDDVYAIDMATLSGELIVSLVGGSENRKGIMALGAEVSADGQTLYIGSGGEHAVEVVDLESRTVRGRIPVEQYASAVRLSPDESELYVTCLRGRGFADDATNREGPKSAHFGTVVKVAMPNAAALADYTQMVEDNNLRAMNYFDFSAGNDTPIPSALGAKESPIEYVFWIMKENFAYDTVFGDLEIGTGDPELTLWGETYTPNHHAIARQFTLFDAFVVEADNSVAGHIWAENAIMPDWVMRANLNGMQYPTPGFDEGAVSESPPVLVHFFEHGVSVRSYGTGEQFGPEGFGKYNDLIHAEFPLVATAAYQMRDREKAQIFIDDFHERLANGTWVNFAFLSLPNNHGDGFKLGKPTPDSMMADNDEGLGMIVQAIAESEIWDKSLIFIFEDDAQHGYDHVNARRIPAMAVSPWIKRSYVSPVLYSYMAMFKTTELIFNVPPLTRFDAKAPAMYDIFRAKPEMSGYTKLDRLFPEELWDGNSKALGEESAKINWDVLDEAEGAAELFWRYRKGTNPPSRYIKY